jgi:hypothetical protein
LVTVFTSLTGQRESSGSIAGEKEIPPSKPDAKIVPKRRQKAKGRIRQTKRKTDKGKTQGMGEWKEKDQKKRKTVDNMRLMIVVDGAEMGERLLRGVYASGEKWRAEVFLTAENAEAAFRGKEGGLTTALLLQGVEGAKMGRRLLESSPVCPPVTLCLLADNEEKPPYADCAVARDASPAAMTALLDKLAKKPLPILAAARGEECSRAVGDFLSRLGMDCGSKGRSYAGWCLERCVVSPAGTTLSMQELYGECARAFHTTGAAVERCLRAAVEKVFTQGDLGGTERFYGSISDPERGKPTNRVFLMHGVEEIRSLLDSAALGEKQ